MDGAGQLLRRVSHGDRAALKMLYDDVAPKLLGVATRIVGDRADAEDIVQDVFVTVWRKAAEYDPARAGGLAWLVAITRNRAIDRVRARGRQPTVSEDAAAHVPDPQARADAGADASDAARAVGRALAALDPKHAAVIRGAWLEGLSYEELARREAVPVVTVKTWVFRGLRRMREGMTP
jgi:RNA polymerase sigma-70 factor (ECF subfamily)